MFRSRWQSTFVSFCLALSVATHLRAEQSGFLIRILDEQTGRGVPLVELKTVNAIRFYSDSNGLVWINDPGLMNRKVFFFVKSHGYEFPADGFGMRGTALSVDPNGHAELKLRRVNIAERLYRITGGEIYGDTVQAGLDPPISQPLLNGRVMGQDSVFTVVHNGLLYWFWGDTQRPEYPLGNFHMSGATSRLPADGGLDPNVGVNLEYFVDETGFSREMARVSGEGPTWLDAMIVLPNDQGHETIYAAYAKIRPRRLEAYERGLAAFDEDEQRFEKWLSFPLDTAVFPAGHAFKHSDRGVDYAYFATPCPWTRVVATGRDFGNLDAYQAFTCLREGSDLENPVIDRLADGRVRYAWKTATPVVGPQAQEKLIRSGQLKRSETLLQLQEADTGKTVQAHAGSVEWNDYRQRWVMIVCEQFGTSFLGETWFAEADSPVGPWVYARKIVTHEQYSFYNPMQHRAFAQQNGRILFFEGTYTNTFSGNPDQTPRYDYNQILYRLDLADPRLILPVPVYRISKPDGKLTWATAAVAAVEPGKHPIEFFALDRPREGVVPVRVESDSDGAIRLVVSSPSKTAERQDEVPAFYALPVDANARPAAAVPLFEYQTKDGLQNVYSTDSESPAPELKRSAGPLCYVWRNPLAGNVVWMP